MKKMIKTLVIFTCLMSTGCQQNHLANDTITVIDMEGTEVVVPKEVKRVAAISQSATDMMIAFGLGDKIAGTYRSFTYNRWVNELYPKAADFKAYSYSVTAEELLKDKIDLVIIQNTENAQTFRNAGIPVLAVHQYTTNGKFDDEVYDIARILKEIFPQVKNQADAWIQEVKDTIDDIKSKIGETNSENSVYYVNGEKSKGLYYSDGGNSMISRIFEVANVRLATEKYEVLNVHKVSDEEMVRLNPYAMMIGGTYQTNLFQSLADSSVWSALDCNQNQRVYHIPVCMQGIENVGVETSLMLKYTANLFNPSYTFDLYTEMKATIKKYFNYDLTDSDVENMAKGLDKNGDNMINE